MQVEFDPHSQRDRCREDREKPAAIPEGLPRDEARVLARLSIADPVDVDALAREAGMPTGMLLDALVSLAVRRLVRPVPGGRYVRTP